MKIEIVEDAEHPREPLKAEVDGYDAALSAAFEACAYFGMTQVNIYERGEGQNWLIGHVRRELVD